MTIADFLADFDVLKGYDWPVPAWVPPKVKSAAGYIPPSDLLDVFVGQEGTLGIITRATVRLTDLPHDVMGLVAFFPDRPAAVAFVRHLRAAGTTHLLVNPVMLRIWERSGWNDPLVTADRVVAAAEAHATLEREFPNGVRIYRLAGERIE